MNDDRRHWHWEKSINIGHILSTLVIAGAMINYTTNIDKRVQLNTARYDGLVKAIDKNEMMQNRQYGELRDDMKRLHEKLDNLIIRLSKWK